MNLVVHIEQLVLEGVTLDGRERGVLRARLEQELAGQLAGRPLTAELAGGAAVPRLHAPAVELVAARPGGAAGDLATRVAGSLATSLAGPATTPAEAPTGGSR